MLRKRMMADFSNHLEFAMVSKSIIASFIWFFSSALAWWLVPLVRKLTYAVSVFDQDLIISTDGHQEQHNLHVIKHMNPLFPF